MQEETSPKLIQWMSDNHYISKANWQSYVDYSHQDKSYEFLGYLEATRGILNQLKQALISNEPEQLRTVIIQIIENRESLIEHAEHIMDRELTVSNSSQPA
ncbi:hypothetical protein [uncultured Fibrella sp.]|uniref:hypothetical protein n=1 Tax=uncultured Fibrella sp. TaxID=1284596 RepID=UPI0035C9C088